MAVGVVKVGICVGDGRCPGSGSRCYVGKNVILVACRNSDEFVGGRRHIVVRHDGGT